MAGQGARGARDDAVDVQQAARTAIAGRHLAGPGTPVLLMVSGGSDSTALAYIMHALRAEGAVGPLAMLHVNHRLRGADADADAQFVARLAALLDIPLFACDVDVAGIAARTGENIEAAGRRERYVAANEALRSLCLHAAAPLADGRIFTAHTADDRIESFYMRSIVGTGPGGFRGMRYRNGPVARPLLDVEREALRGYLAAREQAGAPVVRDGAGALWREDATNAHTDRFRAYVRHKVVPPARERNPQLAGTLVRTMNLIADEDDMLEGMAAALVENQVSWLECAEGRAPAFDAGCVLAPGLGAHPLPLVRRAAVQVLARMLGPDERIEAATVEAVLAAWQAPDGERVGEGAGPGGAAARTPRSGYVTNIQGNLAVSANKHGVRIEPMAAFRARRKK